jgi:hypothetical protein
VCSGHEDKSSSIGSIDVVIRAISQDRVIMVLSGVDARKAYWVTALVWPDQRPVFWCRNMTCIHFSA